MCDFNQKNDDVEEGAPEHEEETTNLGIKNIGKIIIVLSGKGGVGKSTFTANLAHHLWLRGHRVGVLDIDLCGPSIPAMFNAREAKIRRCEIGWLPAEPAPRLFLVSLSFLQEQREEAVIWRGPKKTKMIQQFLSDVCWGRLDFLIVDTPPGTSDEKMTLVKELKELTSATNTPRQLAGALVVTTPQLVSIADVRRELTFCQQTQIPVLGLVENMSGFCCPGCGCVSKPFGSSGGAALARSRNIAFLGSVPLILKDEKHFESRSNEETNTANTERNAQLGFIKEIDVISQQILEKFQ